MPMRATTVRFTEDLWGLLERGAAQEGVSAAQFVREATILRLAHLAGRRGDAEAVASIRDVARGAIGEAVRAPAPPPGAVTDPGRLSAVRRTGLLAGDPAQADEAFDRLANLAATVVRAAVALVTVVDRERQVFRGCAGLPEPWASRRQTPLSHSVCQHVVAAREPVVIEDLRRDAKLRDSLAVHDLGMVAYLGVPLIDDEGHALGTLCVVDDHPRRWTATEVAVVRDLAASVLSEIRLRAAAAAVAAAAAR